jgi:NADPH:quinone reductase-like Zn-dependent oxidoreductase
MTTENKAAWIDSKGQALRVGPAEIFKPGPGEVLIKNHAIGLNPVDYYRRDSGMFVQEWPVIVGSDVAGEIVEVGEDVKDFASGQRVVTHGLGLVSGRNQDAAFQLYTIAKTSVTALIPNEIPSENAAVIPMGVSTASAGLYQPGLLELPLPSLSPRSAGKSLLVLGGSSSVGSSAVQLAVASGLDVIATASEVNFDFVKDIGAREVYNRDSLTLVEDLTKALKGKELVGVYSGNYM